MYDSRLGVRLDSYTRIDILPGSNLDSDSRVEYSKNICGVNCDRKALRHTLKAAVWDKHPSVYRTNFGLKHCFFNYRLIK